MKQTVYKCLIFILFIALIGTIKIININNSIIKKEKTDKEKFYLYYQLLFQWYMSKYKTSIEQKLIEMGLKNIAIYGMGNLGIMLHKELSTGKINVVYGVDVSSQISTEGLEIYNIDDVLPSADAIIVTPVYFFSEIKNNLSRVVDFPIISLDDLIK